MPSHADTIATALRERVAAIGASVGTAGRGFTRAVQGVAGASDVEDVMRAALTAVDAARALHKAADTAVEDATAALAEAIESSGIPSVQTEHLTAFLKRQQAFVSISDEALIPKHYYVETLDKRALKSALVDGLEVPGASLATRNARTLAIRARN
jgi:hypothetical protein